MVLYRFTVDETKCMNCGACMDLCPFTAIEFSRPDDVTFYGALYKYNPADPLGENSRKDWMMEKPYLIAPERCTGCRICVRECPTNAITLDVLGDSIAIKPKPVIIKKEPVKEDGTWHGLSEYTRDYLKRPVRSPWSGVGEWKPMTKERKVNQPWRSMDFEN